MTSTERLGLAINVVSELCGWKLALKSPGRESEDFRFADLNDGIATQLIT
jgi:hypothetical protein